MAEGFLLGPDLLARTRRTIEAVEGGVVRSGFRSTPAVLEGEISSNPKVFRICTFTGAWAINSTKTVTFKYQTTAPNTVNVTNLFFPIGGTATSSVDCAIAKDGTAWYLIDVPLATATALLIGATATGIVVQSTATQSVISDVAVAATFNTANCSVVVNRTQTTASVKVVGVTATGIQVVSTYTATFITFRAQ